MAALRFGLKCTAHPAGGGTPLLNLINALEAYLNLFKLDMSSRYAGPLNVIYNFETASILFLSPIACSGIYTPIAIIIDPRG
jgi:hypothetical protein